MKSWASDLLADLDPAYFPMTPAEYAIKAGRGRWKMKKHLEVLNDALVRVAAGDLQFLMVDMPPRHGKSEFVSKYFPAWYLGTFPDRRVILTSYEADFAAKWGRKARDLLEETGPTYFGEPISIRQDSKSASRWDIAGYDGGMITAGTGGPITGQGGNCLSGDTQIITSNGPRRIRDIVERGELPCVLSFNHATGKPEWRNVTAVRKSRSSRLIEITTTRGNKILATPEHRFFVPERGYQEADHLCPGDRLIIPEKIENQQVVPDLRKADGKRQRRLQRLLSQTPGRESHPPLLILRKRVRAATVRLPESLAARMRRRVLLADLLPKAPRRQECQALRMVRETHAKQAQPVLQSGLHQRTPSGIENPENLSGMRKGIHSKTFGHPVLLARLCKPRALKADDRIREFKLQRWHQLCKVVRRNAAADTRKRRQSMCHMRPCRSSPGSPHQRSCPGQYSGESDCTLPDMPCCPSQIEYDAVAVVRELCCGEIPVYDIQVEGTSNFFAENVLVHNCIIIDDPVKNDQQANSKTFRDKADEWYKSTLYTRLEPGGAIILVMTRWNKDDLAGRRLAEMGAGGDQWEVITFPAIAEENDILGRAPGEPLWPERYPLEKLQKIKRTLGPYWWNALYQQSPGDPEGNMFKRSFFRYFEVQGDQYVLHRPEGDKQYYRDNCIVFQTCDPAGSTKAFADYFVLGTWAVTPHNELLLLDIIRDRLEGPDQPEIFQAAYDRWHPVAQGVESKNMGLTLFQTLQRTALPVEELKPDGDKITRARPMAARYKSGMVYHPQHAAWLGDYEDELTGFPNAGHDDQVDVASYAYVMLMDLDRYRPTEYKNGDYFL